MTESSTETPRFERFNAPGVYETYVRQLGGDLCEADLIVDGIHCAGCVRTIETGLREAGALEAQVNFGTHRAAVRWEEGRMRLGDLLRTLHKLGYAAHPYDPNTQEKLHRRQIRQALARMGVAGFGAGNVMLYAVALWAGATYGIDPGWRALFQWVSFAICVPVLIYSGWPFLRGAWSGVVNRRFNMDSLITLGLLTAFGYSVVVLVAFPGEETYFESVVMVIFFLLIGRFLETLARGRSGSVTEGLMSLQGKWATRLGDGTEETVPIEEVKRGDRLAVRTGEAIPTDGVVLAGESEVDESALTGEARLRAVRAGDALLGGTVNRGAAIEMEANRVGAETVLARVCRLVERAQTEKAPIQRIADRIAGHFVQAILTLSAASFVFWEWVWPGAAPQPAWITAIAVLIIACPCALGLATPVAVIAGSSRAARRGILIKGGDVLERAARVTDVVMDKTGTLTTGGLAVTALHSLTESPEPVWLGQAAALERRALHPIAEALQAHLERIAPGALAALPRPEDVRVLAGRGVQGRVGDHDVAVGNGRMLEACGIAPPEGDAEEETDTVVHVAVDGRVCGRIRLADPLRPNAARVVEALREAGIAVHLFSGDREAAVAALAVRVGIEHAQGAMLPDEKLEALRALQGEGRIVAMIGDGINDAPALTQSDLGIAVSTGSDLALEAANVILMRSRLEGAVEALAISRRALRAIRENLALSIGYNLLAVPLAMAGFVTPLIAALAMSSSSLLVVGNAMRLRLTERRDDEAPALARAEVRARTA